MRVLFLLLCIPPLGATSLTGTLKLPDGTSATGYLHFSLSQQAALSSAGGCGGPAEIVPTKKVRYTVTSGGIGSANIYGNDCLLPQGTYYNVQLTDTQGNTLFTDRWVITGSSVDMGTIVSAIVSGTTQTLGAVGILLTLPTGDQNVAQPVGTRTDINRFYVSDTLFLPNGGQCTVSGCTNIVTNAVTLSGNQSIGGTKTFTSSVLFSGATDVGSGAAPAQYGFFSGAVLSPIMKITLGPMSSPTDFYGFQMPGTHVLELKNSSNTSVLTFTENTAFPAWTFNGSIVADGGFKLNIITTDLPCATSGYAGIVAVRSNTTPPQLQVCIGTTLRKTDLN